MNALPEKPSFTTEAATRYATAAACAGAAYIAGLASGKYSTSFHDWTAVLGVAGTAIVFAIFAWARDLFIWRTQLTGYYLDLEETAYTALEENAALEAERAEWDRKNAHLLGRIMRLTARAHGVTDGVKPGTVLASSPYPRPAHMGGEQ